MSSLSTLISSGNSLPAIIVPLKPKALIISYQQLYLDVSSFQAKLAASGVGTQCAVSIAMLNSYEFMVAFLAISWQRAVAAPLNPAYKEAEFGFYIKDLKSSIVLVPRHAFRQREGVVRAACKYHVAIAECYWNGHEVVLDLKDRGKLAGIGDQPIQMAKQDDTALVLHTSGTTGRPKAVNANIHLLKSGSQTKTWNRCL